MQVILENICKEYCVNYFEKKTVLNGCCIKIDSRQINILVGKSGIGKTTLLNIIGLVEDADEGVYLYNGEVMKRKRRKDILKFRNANIGYIHQESMMVPELTALENVMIPIYIRGKVSETDYRRAYQLMKRLNIYELKDVNVKKLSGGEKQRVEAVRALVTEPDVVLADEPTGALDRENGGIIIDLLREINEKHDTLILIATHDEKIIKSNDKVIKLKEN